MAKIIVDRWFYVYCSPGYNDSDKGCCFENEMMEHLYAIYGVKIHCHTIPSTQQFTV